MGRWSPSSNFLTGCKYNWRYFLMIQGQNCFRARLFQIADLSWRIKRDVIFFLILLEDSIFFVSFCEWLQNRITTKGQECKVKMNSRLVLILLFVIFCFTYWMLQTDKKSVAYLFLWSAGPVAFPMSSYRYIFSGECQLIEVMK